MTKRRALVLLACLALCASQAVGTQPEAMADVRIVGPRVEFQLKGPFEGLTLRISGPDGFYYQEPWEPGEMPVFHLDRAAGDGVYTYELRIPRAPGDEAGPPRVQSGSFEIRGGTFVVDAGGDTQSQPGDRRAFVWKAFVTHSDNTVIDGNLAVGTDVDATPQSTETFGDEVIKIKDPHTEIFFDDTSTSGPDNDWRLIANDVSGSAEYFAIQDVGGGNQVFRVDQGAPANAVRIDSSGELGLGTAAPAKSLHVVKSAPAIRLEKDTATTQTWDITADDTAFRIIDETGNSTAPSFEIAAGAPAPSIYVAENGDVGIGTDSPGANLHLLLSGTPISAHPNTAFLIQNTGSTNAGAQLSLVGGTESNSNGQIAFGDVTGQFQGRIFYSTPNDYMRFDTNGAERMRILSDGKVGIGVTSVGSGYAIVHSSGASLTTGGVWTDASSRSLKEAVRPLSTNAAMAAFRALEPVTFRFKASPEEEHVGFIAEDVPDLVAAVDRKGLAPMDVTAVLTRVVQEQQRIIEEQRAELAALAQRVATLESHDP